MSSVPWPRSFDTILRAHLDLGPDEDIAAEMNLADHGLDSMATVSLLLELEEAYALTIPDDKLITLVNADVAGLWALLEETGAKGDDHDLAVPVDGSSRRA